MKNKLIPFLLYFGLFFGIILLATHGLFNNFFEQDEWGAIGEVIHNIHLPLWHVFVARGVHFSPIGNLLWITLYQAFGLHAEYYTLIQLSLHALASYMVYLLASKLTQDKRVGFLTAVLFAVNGRAYEAFMHLAVNTTVGVFFFITAFFVYLERVKQKVFTLRNIIVLYLLFLSAVFIREEGIMIVPLFVSYILIFDRPKLNRRNLKSFGYLLGGLIGFLILRYMGQQLNTNYIPASSQASYGSVMYNLAFLPFKLVVQNIVSGIALFKYLIANGHHIYPDMHVSVLDAYPVFMDLAFVFIFSMLTIIYGVWVVVAANTKAVKTIVFSGVWLVCHAFILSYVGRRLYIVDERYLYISGFPVLLALSMCFVSVFTSKSRHIIFSLIKKLVVVGAVGVLVYTSYAEIQAAVQHKTFTAHARKSILQSVLSVHPTIPHNTIFYFQCKGVCHKNEMFSLSPAWVLPFSSGPGWNLLVLYSQKQEAIWGKFLTDNFLLDLNSQGYKQIGNDGFGYFIDKKQVVQALRENHLPSSVVIAMEYNEETFTARDISNDLKWEIDIK